MKKFFYALALTMGFIILSGKCAYAADDENMRIVKQDLLVLMVSYKGYIEDVTKNDQGSIFIITKSGKKILYDDKKEKGPDGKMNYSDLQDTLEEPYPLHMIDNLMEVNCDPGRYRCYALFDEVYGKNSSEISKNLIGVYAPYNKYLFNKNNNAAESLKEAMAELRNIAKSNRKVAGLIGNINGSYNYRTISGTGKLSPHAYGIALDINSSPNDYWKWSSRENGTKRMRYYPKELVETFEKHDFVWGGKWGHFDILHFEYRPEILMKARYFGPDKTFEGREWFDGVPKDEYVTKCIYRINEVIDQ